MDMSGDSSHSMGDSSSSSMSGMSMSMVFTTDHSTPLYSSAWTPSSTGAYAGTCIFLIVLAVISRMLLAYRGHLERKWHDNAVKRRYVVVAGESAAERQLSNGSEKSEDAVLTTRGMDESVRVVQQGRKGRVLEATPWRLSTDLPRACIFTVQAGVGYLL